MAIIKCPECGSEVSDQALSCPKCGAPIGQSLVDDNSSLGDVENFLDMPWLAFILPPLGFVLYFIRKKDNPEKAKTLLIASCIGLAFDIGGLLYWTII